MYVQTSISSPGAIVYWTCTATPATLAATVNAAGGLPRLDPPSPAAALRRAVHAVTGGRDASWLAFPGQEDRSWSFSRVRRDRRRVSADHVFGCAVDEDGALTFFDEVSEDLAAALREEYNAALDTFTGADLGAWLLDLVTATHGTSMRRRGTLYFVPKAHLDTWRRAKVLLTTCEVFLLEVLDGPEMVDAFATAMAHEVLDATAEIDDLIAAGRTRALQNRIGAVSALEARITEFNGLLGHHAEVFAAAAQALSARVVEAAFTREEVG